MKDVIFLQRQVIQLRDLVARSAGEPVLLMQLEERLQDAEDELDEAKRRPGFLWPKETVVLPRAAIFLKGGGVHGSTGIRPSLAGQALIQYEGLYTEQALHDERTAAKAQGRQRRTRGAPTPGLLFIGTPRGSFGLEFIPEHRADDISLDFQAKSLENVASALLLIAESDRESLARNIEMLPRKMIPYITKLFKTLADCGTEIRFSFAKKPGKAIGVEQLQQAAQRLEADVAQEVIPVLGEFRGVTLDSGKFDFRTDEGLSISGKVSDELTDEEILKISSLTNRLCTAKIDRTSVTKVRGGKQYSYVLLQLEPVEPDPPPATPVPVTDVPSSAHPSQQEAITAGHEMLRQQGSGELTRPAPEQADADKDTVSPGLDPNPPRDGDR